MYQSKVVFFGIYIYKYIYTFCSFHLSTIEAKVLIKIIPLDIKQEAAEQQACKAGSAG